jgi:hypothetical protein
MAVGTCIDGTVSGANLDAAAWTILIVKTAIELTAGTYGIAFLISALAFLSMREDAVAGRVRSARPPVGILYLCCDDADWSALESLTSFVISGPAVPGDPGR